MDLTVVSMVMQWCTLRPFGSEQLQHAISDHHLWKQLACNKTVINMLEASYA